MIYPLRRHLWYLPLLALGLLHGCASGPADYQPRPSQFEQSAEFPLPEGLEDAVGFWRNVFAIWSRGQVAIHDNRHLGLVYEVANLPGPIEESYTELQRDFVRARRELWSARLRTLEQKSLRNQPLDRNERELREKISAQAGPTAFIGAAERVRSQRGVRERFLRGLIVSGRYDAKFREIFRRHGLPEDLAFLPHVESSFQLNARSSVGASGVWQFMRATARDFMRVDGVIDERLDPVVAADGAARYLKSAYARLGSWPLAITSYNHGVGGMQRARAAYGNDFMRIVRHWDGRHFGFASRNFYAEFVAVRHIVRNANRYFPGVRLDPPLDDVPVVLRSDTMAADIARQYRVALPELFARNLAWLAPIRTGRAPVPAGTTVWLPRGAAGQDPSGLPRARPI
ncbi:MAG: lytic transglycosylase [Chromatiaceae bacterium]|nr:MAG: lytic transglycosylase [Chromatiaceae bacterium]